MGDVFDINKFRKLKAEQVGLKPSADGKIYGSTEDQDFQNRRERIQASLEKINKLMAELKKLSRSENEVR